MAMKKVHVIGLVCNVFIAILFKRREKDYKGVWQSFRNKLVRKYMYMYTHKYNQLIIAIN